MSSKYAQRGVSAQKEDVFLAIKNLDKGLFPNAFAKVLPDILGNDPDFCNIIHADGAGTKSALAYAYWKQTGDISVWYDLAQDAIVMNTDDLLCVGITDNFLISNTIGRNKNLIPAQVVSALIEGFSKFIDKMKQFDINIFLGGGETADIGDLVRTVVVDTTIVARVPKSEIISVDLKPNQVIVALASDGKAIYEDRFNSGIGSNGLTSARHDIFNKSLARLFPETYDHSIPENLIYSGKFNLTDKVPEYPDITMGKFVLSPTRTYLPLMKQVFANFKNKISAVIHCTGGGQTKVLKFLNSNLKIIKDNLMPIPYIFNLIKHLSNADWKEMYQVFNMGHLLEIYTDEITAFRIIELALQFKIKAQIIGRVEKSDKPKLIIQTPQVYLEFEK